MLIAQLTDTHLKPGGRPAYGRVDTAGLLVAAIDHVNALTPAVDAVILSGDLTDTGTAAEYAVLRPLLNRLRMPWYAVPGNHDRADALKAAFGDVVPFAPAVDFAACVVEDFPLRLIGLDSSVDGVPWGMIGTAQLAWLDATLAARPDAPTLVFVHHPPFETGIGHMDVQNLSDGEALIAVLRRHPQLRHLACGHVHRAIDTMIDGVPVSIAPNAAHAVTLDLSPAAPSTFTMEPPAIRLFHLNPAGRLISHLTYPGRFDGPHPFFDKAGGLID
jgi:3',5'-cyclic AMP phosphodiesterase CpdA